MPRDHKNLELMQGYYRFLYLGKFLDELIKHNDLSKYTTDVVVPTWQDTTFTLKGQTIGSLLRDIYNNSDKKNLFGYMVEINALRGIFSSMKELLLRDEEFDYFVHDILKDQAFPFETIVSFLRNVLTHTYSSTIILDEHNISKHKAYLLEKGTPMIVLKFNYAKYIWGWTGNKDYGLYIKINFKSLKQGQSLFDVVSLHNMYLLCELCYNLSLLYQGSTSMNGSNKK
jgi:hypothetical protein